MSATDRNGNEVKQGDTVFFKCDVEQYGVIDWISPNGKRLGLRGNFSGEYIGGDTDTRQMASDCELEVAS